MNQEEHDRQYSPSQWSKRLGPDAVIQSHITTTATGSEKARKTFRTECDVPYGDGDREVLDILYPAAEDDASLAVIYIHGGMWQALSKQESAFAALSLCPRGATVLAVEYTVAPKGTMTLMVDQILRSIAFAAAKFPAHRIAVVGHSAGGHLAAMALVTDWANVAPAVKEKLTGIVCVSGLFDLAPVQKCYANAALQLTSDEIQHLSPVSNDIALAVPVLVAVGEHETDEFKRHSRDFVSHLQGSACQVKVIEVAGHDHFDVIEKLADCTYELSLAVNSFFYEKL